MSSRHFALKDGLDNPLAEKVYLSEEPSVFTETVLDTVTVVLPGSKPEEEIDQFEALANISFHHRLLVARALERYDLAKASQLLVRFTHTETDEAGPILAKEFANRLIELKEDEQSREARQEDYEKSQPLIAKALEAVTLQAVRSLRGHQNKLAIKELKNLATSPLDTPIKRMAHGAINSRDYSLEGLKGFLNKFLYPSSLRSANHESQLVQNRDETRKENLSGPLGNNPKPKVIGKNLVAAYYFEQTSQFFYDPFELQQILIKVLNSSDGAQVNYFKEIHVHSSPAYHEKFGGPLNAKVAEQLIFVAESESDVPLQSRVLAIKALGHFVCVSVVKMLDKLADHPNKEIKTASSETLHQISPVTLTAARKRIVAEDLLKYLVLPLADRLNALKHENEIIEEFEEFEELIEDVRDAAE